MQFEGRHNHVYYTYIVGIQLFKIIQSAACESAARVTTSYWTSCPRFVVLLRSILQSRRVTEEIILLAYQFSTIIDWAYSQQGYSPIHCITTILPSLSVARRLKHWNNSQCPITVVYVQLWWLQQHITNSVHSRLQWWQKNSSLQTIFRRNCTWLLCVISYIGRLIKNTNYKVTLDYPALGFTRVRFGCESDTLSCVCSLSNQYPWGSKQHSEASFRCDRICVDRQFLEHAPHSLDKHWVLAFEQEIILWELIGASDSTLWSCDNDWMRITWWDNTTCGLWLTRAIMVRL